jgi:hypothetical protein
MLNFFIIYYLLSRVMSIRTPSITLHPISTMITTLAIMMSVGSLAYSNVIAKTALLIIHK